MSASHQGGSSLARERPESTQATAVSERSTRQATPHRDGQVEVLQRISLAVSATLDLTEVLRRIIREITSLFAAHSASVILHDDATNEAELLTSYGGDRAFRRLRYPLPGSLTGWVAAHRRPLRVPRLTRHEWPAVWRLAEQLGASPTRLSALLVPLWVRGTVAGSLEVVWEDPHAIANHEEQLLEAIAAQAAIALDNARLYQDAQAEIAERKRAEAALRESEARFQRIAKATSDVLWDWDIQRDTLWWNEHIQTVLGYAAGEVGAGSTWWMEHIHPEDRERILAKVHEALAGGEQSWADEYRYRRADGSYVEVTDRGHILRDPDGKPVRAFGGMVDVSERKRAEAERQRLQQQLQQAQKLDALGTLAGGIAHDFNNLLAAILGFTELALDDVPPQSPARRPLQEVLTAGRRAKALVRQILTFSRPGDDGRRPLPLAAVVEEACRLLRASLPTALTLRTHIAPALPPVVGNATQLQQVVMNLCVNAMQAMAGQERGTLEIRAEQVEVAPAFAQQQPPLRPGPHLRLRVRDTGCGMAPAVQARLFEPFFTTKPVGEGTGLGLAVAHSIVTSHGGAITVESAVGQGTTMTVYLPCASPGEGDDFSGPPARG